MRAYARLAIAVILMLSLRAVPAFAQSGTASVKGRVTDPSGLAVVGVGIQAANTETNVAYPASTNEDGIYNLPNLPLGSYRIVAQKDGFQSIERQGIVLHVADNITIDFTLQVGAVSQRVTVTEEAPLVNTTSSTLGGLVESHEVQELPLNGRNYINLTLMQPGVAPVQLTAGGSYNGTWFSSNGASIRGNNFLLDGAIMQEVNFGSSANFSGRTLGIDGIEEYRVLTNSFPAEYGITMGSQTIMVSKSGTNRFHGSAFEYLRNDVLDASNFFDKPTATNPARIPPYKRNQFGGSFGGPIQKDKTFFFATFEQLNERLGVTTVDNVFNANCHGAAGAVITQAACPQLSVASATVSAVTAPLLALIPLPNLPGNQFTTPYSQPDRDSFGQIRVDHVFSDKDSVFGRYTIDDDEEVLALAYPQDFINPRLTRHQYATLGETHTFSTSLLNAFSFSFSRTADHRTSPDPFIGPNYSYITGQPMGDLTVGGLTGIFGPIANPPAIQSQNILTLSDDVSKTIGKHTLKFGMMINSWRQFGVQNMKVEGTLAFGNLAQFLTAQATSYAAQLVPPSRPDRTWQFYTTGFYAQDDWRLLHNFTVNAGLRYEPSPNYYSEVNGLSSAFIHPTTDTAETVGPYFLNPTLHNFSPRLGFAWDIFGNGKTSVRGGAALLYNVADMFNGIYNILSAQAPFSIQVSSKTSGTNPLTFPFTFPAGGASASPSTLQYNMQQERLYTENLTIEQQLPFSTVLSVSYAGSRGEHLPDIGDYDPNAPLSITNGIPVWGGTLHRTNPAFTTIPYLGSGGDSSYNALQVVLNKRITKGLQFQSSFTWSKLLDNGVGEASSDDPDSSIYQADPYNTRYDRGPAAFNIPKNWVVNAIYNLPDPKFQERFLEGFTSGWNVMGIYTLRSGFPFNPADMAERSESGVVNGTTNGIDRPNVNPAFTGPIITGNVNQWFNPAAFVLQPAGQLGNASRNDLIGPGFNQLDFAIQKNTKLGFLGEAGNLTFRAEFFNLVNHPNFNPPSNITFAGSPADATESPLGTAGSITSTPANDSREIEFSLRVAF